MCGYNRFEPRKQSAPDESSSAACRQERRPKPAGRFCRGITDDGWNFMSMVFLRWAVLCPSPGLTVGSCRSSPIVDRCTVLLVKDIGQSESQPKTCRNPETRCRLTTSAEQVVGPMRPGIAASDRLDERRKDSSVLVRSSPIMDREALSIGRHTDKGPSPLHGLMARARKANRQRDKVRAVAVCDGLASWRSRAGCIMHMPNEPASCSPRGAQYLRTKSVLHTKYATKVRRTRPTGWPNEARTGALVMQDNKGTVALGGPVDGTSMCFDTTG